MTETTVIYDETRWEKLRESLAGQFGRKPDVSGIVFLIGHRELGQLRSKFSKNDKQDLIHVGVCTLLSRVGYYSFIARDEDGWPHYEAVAGMPALSGKEQENLLKKLIIEYFSEL